MRRALLGIAASIMLVLFIVTYQGAGTSKAVVEEKKFLDALAKEEEAKEESAMHKIISHPVVDRVRTEYKRRNAVKVSSKARGVTVPPTTASVAAPEGTNQEESPRAPTITQAAPNSEDPVTPANEEEPSKVEAPLTFSPSSRTTSSSLDLSTLPTDTVPPMPLEECLNNKKLIPLSDKVPGPEMDNLKFDHVISRKPSSNQEIVKDGYNLFAREVPHPRLTTETLVNNIGNLSTCGPNVAPNVHVSLCARVSRLTVVRLLQEWIVWSKVNGVRGIVLFWDEHTHLNATTTDMAEFKEHIMKPFGDASKSLPPREFEIRFVQDQFVNLAAQCEVAVGELLQTQKKNDKEVSSSWYAAVEEVNEFVAFPGADQARRCAPQYFSQFSDDIGAVQLPWGYVGHNGELGTRARSQLDRTFFGMGAFIGHAKAPRFTTFIKCCKGGSMFRLGAKTKKLNAKDVHVESGGTNARILKYVTRALASFYAAILQNPCVDGSFSYVLHKNAWTADKKLGFVDIQHYNADLYKLYMDLIKSIGYTGARGSRSGRVRNAHTSMRVFDMLKPYTISTNGEPVVNKQFDQKLVDGRYQLMPEKLPGPLSKEKVKAIKDKSPCWAKELLKPTRPNVTFCGYVRNRAKLTAEWILWHHILGVENFRIFDDDSSDGIEDVLQPFVDLGIVTMHKPSLPPYRFGTHPVGGGLLAAYGECAALEKHHGEHKYVGYVDPDEFTVLRSGTCIPEWVEGGIIKSPSKNAGVIIPWREVGHNREVYDNYPTQFDRTRFQMGKADFLERVKCIVRADVAVGMDTAHKVFFPEPYRLVFFNGKPLMSEGWWSGVKEGGDVYNDGFVLHYHSRSFASFVQRYLDGFGDDDNKLWDFSCDQSYGWWHGGTRQGYDQKTYLFNQTDGMWDKYLLLKDSLTP